MPNKKPQPKKKPLKLKILPRTKKLSSNLPINFCRKSQKINEKIETNRKNDTAKEKWVIVIKYPDEYEFSQERVKQEVGRIKPVTYWCMSDEISEDGVYHTHLFLHCSSPVRESTLKNRFDFENFYEGDLFLEPGVGTCIENRDYIFKEGRWRYHEKARTNLRDTHYESCPVPIERQGKRNDIEGVYELARQGFFPIEIADAHRGQALRLEKIEYLVRKLREETYLSEFRNVEVNYIHTTNSSAVVAHIIKSSKRGDFYRVMNYKNPFDKYRGQDVLIFENFFESLEIAEMQSYLDGMPGTILPSRYDDKIACYTKVFIVSNIPLEHQYRSAREEDRQEFLCKISNEWLLEDGQLPQP